MPFAKDNDAAHAHAPRTHASNQPLFPPFPPQICEALATELDPVRVRYWLGVVQARIHRRLVADMAASPATATAPSSSSS